MQQGLGNGVGLRPVGKVAYGGDGEYELFVRVPEHDVPGDFRDAAEREQLAGKFPGRPLQAVGDRAPAVLPDARRPVGDDDPVAAFPVCGAFPEKTVGVFQESGRRPSGEGGMVREAAHEVRSGSHMNAVGFGESFAGVEPVHGGGYRFRVVEGSERVREYIEAAVAQVAGHVVGEAAAESDDAVRLCEADLRASQGYFGNQFHPGKDSILPYYRRHREIIIENKRFAFGFSLFLPI